MLAWIISALPRPAARPVVLALAVAAFAPAPPAQAAGAGGMLAALFATSGPTPDDALKALKAGDFKKARDLYGTLLEREDFDAHSREELLYGLATTEHDLTNYDGSVKNFSEVLHTQDKSLRARAHRGLGQTLYDQGVRGLQQQPKITLQRWTDALRHLEAAQDLDPENKELRENREHVDKMLVQLRQVMKQMEEKQGKKGDKGKKGQKGDKGQGQQGEEGDEGDAGKEGSDPNGEGEPKEPKEGKGEKKEADDGIGGKDAKELPEGRLQAAGSNPGEKEGQKGKEGDKPGGDEKKKTAKEGLSDQRNPRTGYTPGEAEGIIRQYMDEITAPLTNRYHTPPPNKKDW
jgi:tetratricopeptide (TPR) repeat protein